MVETWKGVFDLNKTKKKKMYTELHAKANNETRSSAAWVQTQAT